MIRSDSIDHRRRRKIVGRPILVVPFATENPSSFRRFRSELPYAFDKLLRRLCTAEIDGGELKTTLEKMYVSVVESGDDKLALCVDDLGSRSDERFRIRIVSDRDDLVAENGDRTGLLRSRIHRSNICINDDQVCC